MLFSMLLKPQILHKTHKTIITLNSSMKKKNWSKFLIQFDSILIILKLQIHIDHLSDWFCESISIDIILHYKYKLYNEAI